MERGSGSGDQKPAYRPTGEDPRGAGGRGGRGRGSGFYSRPPMRGQIEGLPLLHYNKTSTTSDEVFKWMSGLKTYAMSNFLPGMDNIFLGDQQAEYPFLDEPDIPDEELQNNKVAMEIWRAAYKEYREDSKKLADHKVKLTGVILGQMSDSSRDQVKTSQEGKEAIDNKDPLLLVKAILGTHLTMGKIDDQQNLYAAERGYQRIEMGESESIANFMRRFNASLSSYRECASRAEKEETLPDDEQQSIHFIMQLNAQYGAFQDTFKRGMIVPKPATLQEAYERVCIFGIGRSHEYREPRHRGVFHTRGGGRAGRGGRGSHGRGHRGGTSFGGRGSCAICHEYGHWKNECPHKKEETDDMVTKAVTQFKDEKRRSGGAKSTEQKNY